MPVVQFSLHVDDRQHVAIPRAAGEDHRLLRKLALWLHEVRVLLPPGTIVAE